MKRTFIDEINKHLTPRQLKIWQRKSGLPPEEEQRYIDFWLGKKLKPKEIVYDQFDCVNRGEPTGGKVKSCQGCRGGGTSLPILNCSIHTKGCVVGHMDIGKGTGLVMCRVCPDRVSKNDLEMQKRSDDFVAQIPPYPEGVYSGRGIVISGGGSYLASAYTTIRMLRHHGCTLPVQLWYLGEREYDKRYEDLLKPFGVEFVDIETHPARKKRKVVKGFGTKLFAVVNSPFAEVLSLDPDNYPAADPTVLFDVPEYRKLGGIYWPDAPHTDKWTHWKMWGVEPRGPCGLETGQYVLHKRLAWEPMLLAEWYDDHPKWCYGLPNEAAGVPRGSRAFTKGDYGDKGPHRVAWAKLKRDYVVFNPIVFPNQLGFTQMGPDGKTPMFVHRCHSKITVEKTNFPTTPQRDTPNMECDLPEEKTLMWYVRELKLALGYLDNLPSLKSIVVGDHDDLKA